MQQRKKDSTEGRKGVVRQLLAVAEFTLKKSEDTEIQSEALEMKKILQARLKQLDQGVAIAA